MTTDTYPAVRACTIVLLAGVVLQIDDVSAGRGIVVDWRTIRCGDELQRGADAFDTARLFVTLVGPDRALRAIARHPDLMTEPDPAPPLAPVAPRIAAFAPNGNGGRRRSFEVGPFDVRVEPHEDDAAQAAFTERLAALAVTLLEDPSIR